MRRLTLGLLCATYVCLSLIVALSLWRNGGGWGAGVAALVGGLGLCFAFHGLIERALETGQVRGDPLAKVILQVAGDLTGFEPIRVVFQLLGG